MIDKAREWWERDYKGSSGLQLDRQKLSSFDLFKRRALQLDNLGDEFDRFIKADRIKLDGNPLYWWLEPTQQRSFPYLARMAIDVYSIPPMSAEAERVFSGARRQVDWSRCRLKASTIETLECLKHWLTSGITKGAYRNEIERIEAEATVTTAIEQAEEQAGEAQERAEEQDNEQAEEEEAATAMIINLEFQRSIEVQASAGSDDTVH